MAEVIWAPRALDDLEALIAHISRDAPITARRFAQKIVARVDSLRNFPERCGFIAEDDSRTYRQLIQETIDSSIESRANE